LARIVVLGSLNMDLVVTVPRLPRPGETVLGERLGRYPGGKGANQAIAAARLGAQVAMVGRVGADGFGPELVANLTANGVDVSGVEPDNSAATGAALIFVGPEGQNMIAVAPGANAGLDTADVERAIDRLRAGGVLVMQLEIPMAVIAPAAVWYSMPPPLSDSIRDSSTRSTRWSSTNAKPETLSTKLRPRPRRWRSAQWGRGSLS